MPKILMLGLLLTATIAAVPTAQSLKSDHYLDIPGISVGESRRSVLEESAGASLRRSNETPTLKVTLASVERNDFVYGEHFTYQVLIENAGSQPVTLPWSPNPGAFEEPVRKSASFLRGGMYLEVESAVEQASVLARIDQQPLFGSTQVPGTLLTLAPGRTALIRSPGQWSATMPDGRTAILRQPDGAVRVRAVFSISTTSDAVLTRSTNTVLLRVQPRQSR